MKIPASQPPVELGLERIHRSLFIVHVPVRRHTFGSFPALNRARASSEIRGDLFPGVQAVL